MDQPASLHSAAVARTSIQGTPDDTSACAFLASTACDTRTSIAATAAPSFSRITSGTRRAAPYPTADSRRTASHDVTHTSSNDSVHPERRPSPGSILPLLLLHAAFVPAQ